MRMMAVSWALVFLVLLAGLVVAAILGIVAMARRGPSPVARLASVPVRAPAPQPDPADRRRILEMVRDGKLGPEEADRLLTALGASHPDGGGSAVCPYCAEAMPPEVAVCPSCGTRLPGSGSPRTVATPAGSSTVSGGAKALALYAVIIGAVVVWESVGGSAFRGIRHPAFLVRGLLGGWGSPRGSRCGADTVQDGFWGSSGRLPKSSRSSCTSFPSTARFCMWGSRPSRTATGGA